MKTTSIKKRDNPISLDSTCVFEDKLKELAADLDIPWTPSKSDQDILDAFNKAFEILKNNNAPREPKTLIITTAMLEAGPDVFRHYLEQGDVRIIIQDRFGEAPRELTKENSGLFPELYDTIILDE